MLRSFLFILCVLQKKFKLKSGNVAISFALRISREKFSNLLLNVEFSIICNFPFNVKRKKTSIKKYKENFLFYEIKMIRKRNCRMTTITAHLLRTQIAIYILIVILLSQKQFFFQMQ
jgi:hypothetical protein